MVDDRLLSVDVQLINDDGDEVWRNASGFSVDQACRNAEDDESEATGDDTWCANEWVAH